MSCKAVSDSTFFSTESVFATVECSGALAFFGFALLNTVSAFLSNYLYSLRHQQRRMLLKLPRYTGAGLESAAWRTEFYKFLSLTTASQLVYLFTVVFIITTNLWQLLIMVLASTASEYVLYELGFLKADKYDLLTTRVDIG
jgi:hypothetical protein